MLRAFLANLVIGPVREQPLPIGAFLYDAFDALFRKNLVVVAVNDRSCSLAVLLIHTGRAAIVAAIDLLAKSALLQLPVKALLRVRNGGVAVDDVLSVAHKADFEFVAHVAPASIVVRQVAGEASAYFPAGTRQDTVVRRPAGLRNISVARAKFHGI